MAGYADLEVGLHRRDGLTWTVELRFNHPKNDADVRLSPDRQLLARFDFAQLESLLYDDEAYGRLLSSGLFADEGVREAWAQARAAASAQGLVLRVRLFVGPSASELHRLRWETLRDPDEDQPLLTDENVLFSRYLSSRDWRPVSLRPRSELRALVLVANPVNLDGYAADGRRFAVVDIEGERERALAGLGGGSVTELLSGGRATLGAAVASLREGYDILYLACHGYLVHDVPQLLLEDDAGRVDRIPGSVLVDRLRELQRPPRLVVLASCQSAGSGDESWSEDEGALAALGPRLAEAGIPAVVAMQGNVSMRTVASFIPAFFGALAEDGQIDRAMAVARAAIRERPDWWSPVLFMRLKSGRIWYAPGFGGERGTFEKWPALFRDIRQGVCTPILGPGLTDVLLGSRQEIAQRWAATFHYPMAEHDREDLAHVAQYLSITQNARFPVAELREHLIKELRGRYGHRLPAELLEASLDEVSLDELVTAAWRAQGSASTDRDPYSVLAGLPFPMYVTTQPSTLLSSALLEAGKKPEVELCQWTQDVFWPESIYDREPGYRPSVQRPLVYHLFGRLGAPDTVALTEDDLFDFLIGVTRDKDLIPTVIRKAFASTALLLLGFRLDEWDFRVLFRSLMAQEGRARRSRYAHVAAQIDPEEGQTLEPDRARSYLERYFGEDDISIYWGPVEQFVQDLAAGWREASQ
jgi:CHAT domain/SIR2-like domain